jgi:uridine kinase
MGMLRDCLVAREARSGYGHLVPARTYASIVEEARARSVGKPTCIVGVDGPSGSGKSTFARRLASVCDAPIIEIDDFVSWRSFAGWWPRFNREVLEPLSRGESIRWGVRDWDNDEFGDAVNGFKELPWSPLVIFDGITCTRAAAGGTIALRVWVDAPGDLRLQRGIDRDGESYRELWLDWIRQEDFFFTGDATRERADVLVDGAPPQGVQFNADDEFLEQSR